MEGGQDNGARLAWCESLFAEAAHVLTMAGVCVRECVRARPRVRVCKHNI